MDWLEGHLLPPTYWVIIKASPCPWQVKGLPTLLREQEANITV